MTSYDSEITGFVTPISSEPTRIQIAQEPCRNTQRQRLRSLRDGFETSLQGREDEAVTGIVTSILDVNDTPMVPGCSWDALLTL